MCALLLSLFSPSPIALDLEGDILPVLDIAPLHSLSSLRSLHVGAFDRYAAMDRLRRPWESCDHDIMILVIRSLDSGPQIMQALKSSLSLDDGHIKSNLPVFMILGP